MWVVPHAWCKLRAFYSWVHRFFITSWKIKSRVALFSVPSPLLHCAGPSAALFHTNKHTSSWDMCPFINYTAGWEQHPCRACMHFQSMVHHIAASWTLLVFCIGLLVPAGDGRYPWLEQSMNPQVVCIMFVYKNRHRTEYEYVHMKGAFKWWPETKKGPEITRSVFCWVNHVHCSVKAIQMCHALCTEGYMHVKFKF